MTRTRTQSHLHAIGRRIDRLRQTGISSLHAVFYSFLAALCGLSRSAGAQEAGTEAGGVASQTINQIGVVQAKFEEITISVLETLPLVAIAIVVLVIFWVLARLMTSSDFLFRWIKNRFTRDLIRQFARAAIIIVGIVLALEAMNATALVGAALGAAGVAGIAIGFAFRDLVENYIAGVLLSTRRPFDPNDLVDINDLRGKVVRLTSRATILLTLDGNHLRIPNAVVFKGIIYNYTRNATRRFDVAVGVGVEEDLLEAQELGISILRGMTAVLEDPEPSSVIEELGDSNVALRFYAWVDQTRSDYFKAKSEGIRLIKTAFDAKEIEMPEPIYRVMLKSVDEPTPAEAAKKRNRTDEMREQDTSADETIDRQVLAERMSEGPDLLDERAPKE